MTFLLFMGLVGLLAIAVGVATGWDALAEDGRNPLDPDTIWRELVADSTPGGEERRWLDELAVLELPRRHRIC